jgi:hypothetical protein
MAVQFLSQRVSISRNVIFKIHDDEGNGMIIFIFRMLASELALLSPSLALETLSLDVSSSSLLIRSLLLPLCSPLCYLSSFQSPIHLHSLASRWIENSNVSPILFALSLSLHIHFFRSEFQSSPINFISLSASTLAGSCSCSLLI